MRQHEPVMAKAHRFRCSFWLHYKVKTPRNITSLHPRTSADKAIKDAFAFGVQTMLG